MSFKQTADNYCSAGPTDGWWDKQHKTAETTCNLNLPPIWFISRPLTFQPIHHVWSRTSSAQEPIDSATNPQCPARRQTVSSPPSFSAPTIIEFSTRAEGHAMNAASLHHIIRWLPVNHSLHMTHLEVLSSGRRVQVNRTRSCDTEHGRYCSPCHDRKQITHLLFYLLCYRPT